MSRESYDILNRIHEADGQLNYGLAVFGDEIAKREGYRELEGLEAVHFYLIQKHHWLPRDVKSMSFDDLRFVLTEEMSGWTWPAEARPSTGT